MVRKLLALVTCLVTGLAGATQAFAAELEVPPGFVVQILEPIGGKIARPKEWFYSEQHQPPTFRWTLSKEDPALGPYETGMRVQLFIGVEKGTGKTPRQFVSDIVKSRTAAGRVLSECPPENQGLFTRVCLETEERLPAMGPRLFRVQYSLFWGNESDMVCVVIAGTPADQWEQYRSTFDVMRAFDLIDPARFPK
jgi:hypothetical protein